MKIQIWCFMWGILVGALLFGQTSNASCDGSDRVKFLGEMR